MARIRAFKGFLYNKKKVGNIASVLAPPYDVITPETQAALYRASDYNIVRLTLGRQMPGDDGRDNRYKRAARFFRQLVKDRILARDKSPCIYVYDQAYTLMGEKKNRTGFIALIKLEDKKNNKVMPHERTFSGPKKDRLRLMREVRANLSPIFSVFQDTGGVITKILERETAKRPVFDVIYDGVRQRLWRISSPAVIRKMAGYMKGRRIFIADGHHRYEVALAFRDEIRKKAKRSPKRGLYDYVMMYFTSLDEARLTILATHRVIKDIGETGRDKILPLIEDYFTVKRYARFKQMEKDQKRFNTGPALGMYCGGSFYLLLLRRTLAADKIIKENKSTAWKRLDVTLLHRLVLRRILKISDREDNVEYLRDAKAAIGKVRKGGYKLAFFLNPTRLEQVKNIAETGEKMPHKSTYFYPKLSSGVVINRLG